MLDRIRFQAGLGICLVLLSACGGGGGGGGSSIPTQILITPEQDSLVVGETISFSATAITSTGKEVDNIPFNWQSLDLEIASVDGNGIVTAKNIGVATIAVTGTFTVAKVSKTIRGTATVGVFSPNSGQSNLTFSGKAQYEDKLYDMDGFTDETELLPIRGAIVNIVAIQNFTTIATSVTDNEGNFSFSGVDNSSRQAGTYVQVVSKTEPDNPAQIEIRNNMTDEALLSVISQGFDDSGGIEFNNIDVTATADSDAGGLFNILDVFSTASEFIQQKGGLCKQPDTTSCVPPPLVVYWEPGSAEGSYYDDQLDVIFILGGGDTAGDHDEYDDAVIAHEYGHFTARHFSKDDSQGGPHFITDNGQDIRLSFSEGWGNFFSSAVRNNPVYLDTTRGGYFSFSVEDYNASPDTLPPSSLNSTALYTTSEIAITGVLWDLFDGGSLISSVITEPHDQIGVDFEPIWQVLLKLSDLPAATPTTMETFWIQFESDYPGSAAGLQAIMQERAIELFADRTETDGQTPEGTILSESDDDTDRSQHHTLYQTAPNAPTDDEDVIQFSVTPGVKYRLETLNLTNGADTFLFITDSPSSSTALPGLQNDNRNGRNYQSCSVNPFSGSSSCPDNGDILSSSITWTAGNTTTLYAHVKRSPNAPPSSGRFGAYDIQLKRVEP